MTAIPTKYQWLSRCGLLPRCIQRGLELYGVQEIVGKGSNKTIIGWRDELNQNGVPIVGYADDDIPWCGLYAAIVVYRARGSAEVVKDPLWALNWRKFGVETDKPSLGDVLVYGRNGGGHVGFYIGEDSACYHTLGGNQANAVNIIRIQKDRLLCATRPRYANPPKSAKPFLMASAGLVSSNEA